jgi:hypothetical protein
MIFPASCSVKTTTSKEGSIAAIAAPMIPKRIVSGYINKAIKTSCRRFSLVRTSGLPAARYRFSVVLRRDLLRSVETQHLEGGEG